MRTPEQLKGKIRNVALETGLSTQEILQMYLFERVLMRLSVSKYSKKFILKGGLLISSMLGIAEHSTMDMDTTVTGIDMDEQTISSIVQEVLAIEVDDDILFQFKKIEHIREDDEYCNFRVHFNAVYGKINNHMKLDITTGDVITPRAIEYTFRTIFDNEEIPVTAYNLETIVAEKYETIIRRNISNSRARDFYDLYKFFKLYKNKINQEIFREALNNTAKRRESLEDMQEAEDIISDIRNEKYLMNLWTNYTSTNAFAKDISYDEIMETLEEVRSFLL